MLVRMQICSDTMEIIMAIAQEDEDLSTSRSSYSTLGHMPKDISSHYKDTSSKMFIPDLLRIAKHWEQK